MMISRTPGGKGQDTCAQSALAPREMHMGKKRYRMNMYDRIKIVSAQAQSQTLISNDF